MFYAVSIMGIAVLNNRRWNASMAKEFRARFSHGVLESLEAVDLIGATALRHNLTILTNNRRHFERIDCGTHPWSAAEGLHGGSGGTHGHLRVYSDASDHTDLLTAGDP